MKRQNHCWSQSCGWRLQTARLLGCLGWVACILTWVGSSHVWAVEVKEIKTKPSGIKIWMVEDHALPVVSIQFALHAGKIFEPVGKEGISDFLAAMLLEGAGSYDSKALNRILLESAISLDFSSQTEWIRGSVKCLREHADQAFDLLNLILTEPRFDQDAMERTAKSLIVQLQDQRSNPREVADEGFWKMMLGDSPYAKPFLGTEDSVRSITADDLRRFMKQGFAQDTLIVSASGDVTEKDLIAWAEKGFSKLAKKSKFVQIPTPDVRSIAIEQSQNMPVAQTVIAFGQPGITRTDPDLYAAMIANYVLGGGGFSSRLMHEIREKRGLTYGIGTEFTMFKTFGLWMGSMSTKHESVQESIQLIKQEWQKMSSQGISEDEFSKAKSYLLGSYVHQFDTNSKTSSILLNWQISGRSLKDLRERNANLEKTTLDQVQKKVKSMIKPDSLSFYIVGQLPSPAPAKP